MRLTPLLATVAVTLAACDVSHTPTLPARAKPPIAGLGVADSLLHFLTPASGAPQLVSDTVQFYAVVGQDRHDSIYYHAASGQSDSVRFLYFDVPSGALVTDANGNTLSSGDSLLITIALVDTAHLKVAFQPSGLTFAMAHPAHLTLSYAWASSGSLPSLLSLLGVWQQETPGGLWFPTLSSLNMLAQTQTATVDGFSVYASAY